MKCRCFFVFKAPMTRPDNYQCPRGQLMIQGLTIMSTIRRPRTTSSSMGPGLQRCFWVGDKPFHHWRYMSRTDFHRTDFLSADVLGFSAADSSNDRRERIISLDLFICLKITSRHLFGRFGGFACCAPGRAGLQCTHPMHPTRLTRDLVLRRTRRRHGRGLKLGFWRTPRRARPT